MNRRKFITSALTGVAAAAVAPHMLFAGSPVPQLTMAGGFSKTNFQKLLNTQFTIVRGVFDQPSAKLVNVTDGPASPNLKQFITTFRGQKTEALPEGLYQVKHPTMGRFQLALKPTSQDTEGTYYEAAFSLLT